MKYMKTELVIKCLKKTGKTEENVDMPPNYLQLTVEMLYFRCGSLLRLLSVSVTVLSSHNVCEKSHVAERPLSDLTRITICV